MNIVAHNHQSRELLSSKISRFLEEFHVGRILKACNAYKVRGFSVKDVFHVAFENAFSSKSFFQKQRESSTSIPFAKDTFYRFMNSSNINWRKFTLRLSSAVIQKIEPLTNEKRRNVLIIDDSLSYDMGRILMSVMQLELIYPKEAGVMLWLHELSVFDVEGFQPAFVDCLHCMLVQTTKLGHLLVGICAEGKQVADVSLQLFRDTVMI